MMFRERLGKTYGAALKTFFLLAMLLTPVAASHAQTPDDRPPFGMWRIPENLYGHAPFNANVLAFDAPHDTPATLLAALDRARAAKIHVFVRLVNFGDRQETPPGNFSIDSWKARYDVWCPRSRSGQKACVNLKPYVDDGTLLGLHIFEYAHAPNYITTFGPTMDEVKQVATYVKTLWPYAPVAIDTSHPCLLAGGGWSHGDVDLVMLTFFTVRFTDYAKGEQLLDRDVACTRDANLQYAMGTNPFGGAQNGLSPTALATFRHYSEYILLHYPEKKAMLIWRWWPSEPLGVGNGVQNFSNFWSEKVNPGVGAAMQEIETCAAHPSAQTCPAGKAGGFAE